MVGPALLTFGGDNPPSEVTFRYTDEREMTLRGASYSEWYQGYQKMFLAYVREALQQQASQQGSPPEPKADEQKVTLLDLAAQYNGDEGDTE